MGAACGREALGEGGGGERGEPRCPYRYPPPSGNYFGTHFIMGGERFDTPQPEAYLFGENGDLNFLGGRPTAFPYPPPAANEPTKTLKSLVNVRKESLRFVRKDKESPLLSLEFTFDADARCTLTLHLFCTEELGEEGPSYRGAYSSPPFRYRKGAHQRFSAPLFDPERHRDEELAFDPDAPEPLFPVAIHAVADDGQSHTTVATIDRHADGTYTPKPLKQKLYVDGLCYLLQEIYGIENKANDAGDQDADDNGGECVICMSEVRDTLILPCRHLCLCNSCADSLRYQANNCPICRAPFRALLQIRALQRHSANAQPPSRPPNAPPDATNDLVPPGYEAVSLIEALNGPCALRSNAPLDSPPADDAERAPPREPLMKIKEIRRSILITREDEREKPTANKITANSPLLADHKSKPNHIAAQEKTSLNDEYCDDVEAEAEKESEIDCEGDSETEKLSPLLTEPGRDDERRADTVDAVEQVTFASQPLRLEAALEPIDDTDTDDPERSSETSAPGAPCPHENETTAPAEDSDYFTPEDTHTTILSSPNQKVNQKTDATVASSTESTPQRWAVSHHIASLPGTPLSHLSNRSSGDSYSSSSSTRHLLSNINPSVGSSTSVPQHPLSVASTIAEK